MTIMSIKDSLTRGLANMALKAIVKNKTGYDIDIDIQSFDLAKVEGGYSANLNVNANFKDGQIIEIVKSNMGL